MFYFITSTVYISQGIYYISVQTGMHIYLYIIILFIKLVLVCFVIISAIYIYAYISKSGAKKAL
jgi:hypothetical protein